MDSGRPQVKLVIDASVTASWLLKRIDPGELSIAELAIEAAQRYGFKVPAIWFTEVANALLAAERRGILTSTSTAKFLADLATLAITPDSADFATVQRGALNQARSLQLTACDATYLELALRTASTLATFDRKLEEAARTAGVPVVGDNP
jgi:predicted nucleic acid-binding protein